MNINTKLINQKPIDIDVSFKYLCPQCNLEHWLFLRETQTKNYKVVCECGQVFTPKRIKKLRIIYNNKTQSAKKTIKLPLDILDECTKILVGYGFDSKKSAKIIELAYKQIKLTDIPSLIKMAIKLFGDNRNV